MEIFLGLFTFVIGYLVGSISFARIVTRLVAPDVDLGQVSITLENNEDEELWGIYGGDAVSMALGAKMGLTVAFIDMVKVAVPMLAIRAIYPAEPYYLFASVGGLIGHNWPIYYGFKGGRGFAVIFGSFIAIDWIGALVTTVGGLAFGMIILGDIMVGYFSWLWLMIPWMVWRWGPWEVAFSVAVNLIFTIGMLPEIRTMIRLQRVGKYDSYLDGLYNSSAHWRGMKKMADRLWLFRPFLHKKSE